MIIFERREMRRVRAYGIFVHGEENVEKVRDYAQAKKGGDTFYAFPVLLGGEVVKEALMICGADEFDRISLSGTWPNWQCKKWLKAELREWEERPSKASLKLFIEKVSLVSDKHTANGHQFYEGPDWFVFIDEDKA